MCSGSLVWYFAGMLLQFEALAEWSSVAAKAHRFFSMQLLLPLKALAMKRRFVPRVHQSSPVIQPATRPTVRPAAQPVTNCVVTEALQYFSPSLPKLIALGLSTVFQIQRANPPSLTGIGPNQPLSSTRVM